MKPGADVAVVTLALALAGSLLAAPDETAAPAVRVIVPRRATVRRWTSASGFLVPKSRCLLSAEVEGRVASLPFDVGDGVEKGALVVRLANAAYDHQVGHAEAVLALREIELKRQEGSARDQALLQLAKGRSDLRIAQAEAQQYRRDFENKTRLSGRGMLAGQELEAARTAHERAAAQVAYLGEEVALTRRLFERGDWSLVVEKARSERNAARETLALERLSVERLAVRSPVSGTVSHRSVDVGASVRPGVELLRVIDTTRIFADCFLDESSVVDVKVGQRAEVRLDDGTRPLKATVAHVAPDISPDTGGYLVRLRLATTGSTPLVGRYGTCRILVEERRRALVVPRMAVIESGGRRSVFSLNEDSTVTECDVSIGLEEDERLEVLGGLDEKRPVVSEGAHTLVSGQTVRVVAEGVETAP